MCRVRTRFGTSFPTTCRGAGAASASCAHRASVVTVWRFLLFHPFRKDSCSASVHVRQACANTVHRLLKDSSRPHRRQNSSLILRLPAGRAEHTARHIIITPFGPDQISPTPCSAGTRDSRRAPPRAAARGPAPGDSPAQRASARQQGLAADTPGESNRPHADHHTPGPQRMTPPPARQSHDRIGGWPGAQHGPGSARHRAAESGGTITGSGVSVASGTNPAPLSASIGPPCPAPTAARPLSSRGRPPPARARRRVQQNVCTSSSPGSRAGGRRSQPVRPGRSAPEPPLAPSRPSPRSVDGVTVWVRTLSLRQVTVSPTGASRCEGRKSAKPIETAVPAAP